MRYISNSRILDIVCLILSFRPYLHFRPFFSNLDLFLMFVVGLCNDAGSYYPHARSP